MAITPATTRGGETKRVHAEFADGSVIGYAENDDYIPIIFPYENAFGEIECAVVRIDGNLFHDKLMRSDGGICETTTSNAIAISWSELSKDVYGYTVAPDGELHEAYGYKLNRECDVVLPEFITTAKTVNRVDRRFWTPNNTTQNDTGYQNPFSLEQLSPNHQPFEYDKCGKPTMEDY